MAVSNENSHILEVKGLIRDHYKWYAYSNTQGKHRRMEHLWGLEAGFPRKFILFLLEIVALPSWQPPSSAIPDTVPILKTP